MPCLRYILDYQEQDVEGRDGWGGHYPVMIDLPPRQSPTAAHLEVEPEPKVHWCHGAPGAVFMFCKAYEVGL